MANRVIGYIPPKKKGGKPVDPKPAETKPAETDKD